MTRKLTITYDRPDGLFEIAEDTEHGGREQYRCTYLTAVEMVNEFVGHSVPHRSAPIVNAISDGYLTSITLEAM